jgi:hypothetical protein
VAPARTFSVGVIGIRAVQAGALTAAIDRNLPLGRPEVRDCRLARGLLALCADSGEDPAMIAHRYELGLPIDALGFWGLRAERDGQAASPRLLEMKTTIRFPSA